MVDTTERVFRKVWEMACYSCFLAGREAARLMLPRGQGNIFFTGATASVRSGPGFAAFASAKFGLRAVAQSMARELGPKNIHVAHLLIDGGVDSEAIRKRMRARIGDAGDSLPPNTLIQTNAIAEAYWNLCTQPTYGWTHELALRTSIVRWGMARARPRLHLWGVSTSRTLRAVWG